jgi:hypothetical protein
VSSHCRRLLAAAIDFHLFKGRPPHNKKKQIF